MKLNQSKLAAAALIGLFSVGTSAQLQASGIAGDHVVAGKDGCSGKDGCKGKDKEKESSNLNDFLAGKDGCSGKDGCEGKDKKNDGEIL